MLCRNPFMKNGVPYGCGQCTPCRVNVKRKWAARMLMESMLQKNNTFITLTYTDAALPRTSKGLPTLSKRDFELFRKRLRTAIAPLRIRYYGCGEYGSQTERPHYHAILFGYPNCDRGATKQDWKGFPLANDCCPNCSLIQRAWSTPIRDDTQDHSNLRFMPLGGVMLGSVNKDTANYVAQYVQKKRHKDNPTLLGRQAEFSTMSGGLGKDFMWDVSSGILSVDRMDDNIDVPSTITIAGKVYPLSRYLRQKLREMLGREKETPQAVIDAMAEEMRPLREAAFANSRSFKKEVIKAGDQKVLNSEKRAEIFKKGSRL